MVRGGECLGTVIRFQGVPLRLNQFPPYWTWPSFSALCFRGWSRLEQCVGELHWKKTDVRSGPTVLEGWRASIWAVSCHSFCRRWAAWPSPCPGSLPRLPRTASSSQRLGARPAAQRGAATWWARKFCACPGRPTRNYPAAPHPAAAASLWGGTQDKAFKVSLRILRNSLNVLLMVL